MSNRYLLHGRKSSTSCEDLFRDALLPSFDTSLTSAIVSFSLLIISAMTCSLLFGHDIKNTGLNLTEVSSSCGSLISEHLNNR